MIEMADFLFGGSTFAAKVGTLIGRFFRLLIAAMIIFATVIFFSGAN